MRELVFPRVDEPKVSVIVATRNGATAHLSKTLEALLLHTERCYELVIVDNGSTDGTVELLRHGLRHVTLVLNTRNFGFGAANNQGAARAVGPTFLFLNDDVFVRPGWLGPLLTRLEADSAVGAAGPKILNVDGSLQGAGALIGRSGATALYGAGDAPGDTGYAFPRIVDFVAGACLLIRRRIFDEIGGYDPLYHPMYFEDADLCLAVRKRGYLVVYEPRSVVTHVRGASGFVRERPLVPLRNRYAFERRWRSLLAARPLAPLDNSRRIVAARDAPAAACVLVAAAGRCDERPLLDLARLCTRTQLTLATSERPTSAERLSDAGVEIAVTEDWSSWLRERRFHYDVVFAEPGSELTPLLSETQPQAVYLDLDTLSKTAHRSGVRLARSLSDAGILVRAAG